MTERSPKRLSSEVFQGVARVQREDRSGGAASFVLQTDVGEVSARRAVSCLVAPVAGDSVLYAAVGGEQCFILAVLERAMDCEITLLVDGDLRVRLPAGRFSVAAQNGVALVSGKDVEVAAPEVSVHVHEAKVSVDRTTFFGGVFEAILERVFQRVKRSHRHIEERDEVRAAAIDYAATENISLRGENTLLTAEDLVKIDAKQIIVG